jgi:predicted Ser/Thr protein kinase
MDPSSSLFATAATLSDEAKELLGRFDSLWHAGQRPDLDEFLSTCPEGQRLVVLIELVHSDLEFRLRAGEPARVEDYLGRYPELTARPSAVRDLIAAEFRQRARMDAALDAGEYVRRFPEHASLIEHLAAARPGPGPEDHTASGLETQATPSLPGGKAGATMAGYEILEELGRGGMGVVYKARQLGCNRLVALKTVRSIDHAGTEELTRFRLEAEAIARLHHPNIVQIYEVGEQGGVPFFSLEYVEGGSLAGLPGEPWDPRRAAHLVEVLARAMQAVHERGVLHRDLKPSNVLLTADGVPKITDFGLAKLMGDSAEQTQTGAILGTPSYMPPEQAVGKSKEVGTAGDVWALGAILYQLLTGRPPFQGENQMEILQQVLTEDPPPPSGVQPTLPRDLETICLTCLQKKPSRRYSTAESLAEDLRRFQAGEPILARRTPAWERPEVGASPAAHGGAGCSDAGRVGPSGVAVGTGGLSDHDEPGAPGHRIER